MKRITRIIAAILGSRRFTIGTLCFFIFEGVWVACSAVYPMAFDEDFHFGLIKMYSHYWLPFLSTQPPNTSQFGAVTRDPSYLYHYLMSFPYRFIELFTHDQTIQVILLRFINIGLFGLGIVLGYKVMRRAGATRVLANTGLALFVLIPIVPLLAAQINYDNMVMPLVAWTCLMILRVDEQLRKRVIDLKLWAILAADCLLSSLVKYAFLPVAFAVFVFVVARVWIAFHGHRHQLGTAFAQAYRTLSKKTVATLIVLLLISGGMFFQRYGLNVISYHTPLPGCNVVLNTDECMSYGPWARNYMDAQTKGAVNRNPVAYSWTWLEGMHYRLFFMVNGPASGFENYAPVPLPSATAVVLVIAGVVALGLAWRRVFSGQNRYFLLFLFLMASLYCLALWVDNYDDFLSTGQPVAINGRYLLVVLLPLIAVFGRALMAIIGRWRGLCTWAAAFAIILFLQGGGVMSFILRSDPQWDWPASPVVHANNAARKILAPPIVEGPK